jgi:hypothetical protein
LNRFNPPTALVADDLGGGIEGANQQVNKKKEGKPEGGPF